MSRPPPPPPLPATADPQALKRTVREALKAVMAADDKKVFAHPVTDDIAPRYSQVIKRPMDLSTMVRRFKAAKARACLLSLPSCRERPAAAGPVGDGSRCAAR